jgi:hypothetical protein
VLVKQLPPLAHSSGVVPEQYERSSGARFDAGQFAALSAFINDVLSQSPAFDLDQTNMLPHQGLFTKTQLSLSGLNL